MIDLYDTGMTDTGALALLKKLTSGTSALESLDMSFNDGISNKVREKLEAALGDTLLEDEDF